jgi:hypothetical protein
MPTENRRIATYLPKHIDDLLEAFKSEHSIKGDSQALITILSEFFGVSQEVTHQSGSARIDEIITAKLTQLKSELLDELLSRLLQTETVFESRFSKVESQLHLIQQVKTEVKDELLSELRSELPKTDEAPGQLKLGLEEESASSEPPSESLGEPQGKSSDWISTREAFDAIKPPSSYDTFRKLSPEKLHELYGLEADPGRKEKGKYNPKWLKLPVTGK